MDAALPLDKSSAFFSSLTQHMGKIQKLGEPQSVGGTMVFSAKFEKGTLDMRIALDGGGLIAGLTFKPHAATKPEQAQVSQADRYTKVANQLKELINAGDYAGIQAKFNKEMGASLPLDKSSEFFIGLTQQVGKIQKLGQPQAVGEAMVFPTDFEKGTLDMEIALDGRGLIAGPTLHAAQADESRAVKAPDAVVAFVQSPPVGWPGGKRHRAFARKQSRKNFPWL